MPGFHIQGIYYRPIIVPSRQPDRAKFIDYLHRENNLSDSLVERFSSDNNYFVLGIHDDGASLIPYIFPSN
ncbi:MULTISPECIES: hypothetical protein [unclassified Tenacibaculum]|nr:MULTISPECIES: hypothetical protein [unclassified Tenacibaculum]MCF2874039.1 hypothetical protein [Tenacibaculum sp. Cn5-1]MCF2934620.1 hypothetical protein [Tenacibaculum sp. Cn5-34]MCG7510830.1 hypothetical protein [Tenacibaculum sp. Cn5-46]